VIVKRFWQSDFLVWTVYTLAVLGASAGKLALGLTEEGYTFYENYRIFRNAFPHLLQGENPYGAFPLEQMDLYKYSPAFALLMAPFAPLPDWLGMPLWNLFNALLLLAAILRLPGLTVAQRRFIAWFVLIELITSVQNSQSNGLTAAGILWAYIALERARPFWAAGWTAGGVFLKIFGGFAAIPAMLYASRRAFMTGLAFWGVALALAPLAVLTPVELENTYRFWVDLLLTDHEASTGLSVAGWLKTWFGWEPSKTGITLAGLGLLLLSVWRHVPYNTLHVRALAWASVLLWVIIFNHKAESPTFVVAMCGVGLWYFWDTTTPPLYKNILLWVTFALVSLSPTDLFPPYVRKMIIRPYVLKAVPCIAVWLLVTWQLFRLPKQRVPHDN
jgi:hypothetical protein